MELDRGDGLGTDLLAVRHGPREVTVPLDVYGATRSEFLQRRKRLQVICARSSPARPVRLTYVEDGGRVEWIQGVYVGGLDGDESVADERSELCAVVIRDGFPYWRGAHIVDQWDVIRPTPNPWFPVIGSFPVSSQVGGRRQVINPGDVEVRADWVIRGPGSGLLLANHTAGWRVEIDHDIPSDGPGSLIVISTAQGSQSVRDGFDVNLFGKITNGPDGGWEMGPLLPGPNDIEVRLDGSGPSSSVILAYDELLVAA